MGEIFPHVNPCLLPFLESTPNLGSKKPPHSPGLYCDLLKSQQIERIPVKEIEDPPLSIDNILYDCS